MYSYRDARAAWDRTDSVFVQLLINGRDAKDKPEMHYIHLHKSQDIFKSARASFLEDLKCKVSI